MDLTAGFTAGFRAYTAMTVGRKSRLDFTLETVFSLQTLSSLPADRFIIAAIAD